MKSVTAIFTETMDLCVILYLWPHFCLARNTNKKMTGTIPFEMTKTEIRLIHTDFSDKHVNIEARDRWGRVALVFAVLGNHQECVELLLQAGAKPDAVDSHKRTPLHFATYKVIMYISFYNPPLSVLSNNSFLHRLHRFLMEWSNISFDYLYTFNLVLSCLFSLECCSACVGKTSSF